MEAHRINAIARPAPSVFARPRFLGILTLDTRFPRFPGDIGNPSSFPVPARARVVRGLAPGHAVRPAEGQGQVDLFTPFAAALRELEAAGAAAITTSCGFLVTLQDRLQALAGVPVVTSSLLLLPELLERLPRVGVLTISAESLGAEYLAAAGVPASRMCDLAIEGIDPGGEFARSILGNTAALDFATARHEVVASAMRLRLREPLLTDLVLECTNLPPYASYIEAATGLRCWSLLQCQRLLSAVRGPRELA